MRNRLSLVATVILLGAGLAGPAEARGGWCPPGTRDESNKNAECVFDVPNREWRARKRQWYEESRALAGKLTVPYQELVFAYLSDWHANGEDRYCLSLFDQKPDDALTGRLKSVNISPRFCYGPKVSNVYIYRITQVSPKRFLVLGGSYCGALCAEQHTTLITRNEDGTLTVGKGDLIWIS